MACVSCMYVFQGVDVTRLGGNAQEGFVAFLARRMLFGENKRCPLKGNRQRFGRYPFYESTRLSGGMGRAWRDLQLCLSESWNGFCGF